jgi:FKBP-type peptidyl-prolyl cis-trans isomerase 2
MAEAITGSSVKVHYTGKLEDGTIFDSSHEREPLEFVVGEGTVIPGFEEAVLGMKEGEQKRATLVPEAAYGPYQNDMLFTIERDRMPEGTLPQVGQHLHLRHADGRSVRLSVVEVSGADVTLDGNHPLAGKTLIFDIQLVSLA